MSEVEDGFFKVVNNNFGVGNAVSNWEFSLEESCKESFYDLCYVERSDFDISFWNECV